MYIYTCSTKRLVKCFVPRQSLSVGGLHCTVTKQTRSFGRGSPKWPYPPGSFLWTLQFLQRKTPAGRSLLCRCLGSHPEEGGWRSGPTTPCSALSPARLLTSAWAQVWRLVPSVSEFWAFPGSGVCTSPTGVCLCMQERARFLWSTDSFTCLSSPRCVDTFHPLLSSRSSSFLPPPRLTGGWDNPL